MKTPDAWIDDNGRVFVNRRKYPDFSFSFDGDRRSTPVWFWEFEPPEESETPTFEKELERLLNKHGIDAKLNTPDYELSWWLVRFIETFDTFLKIKNRGDVGTPSVVVEKTDDRERRVREEDTHRRPHT